tara:strand:- start:6645 stop:6857 length:213 start_codon:yes stop_codon:yes gene_type:complete
MRNLLKANALFFTLFLTTCTHQELKSPCDGVKLAAAHGSYIPCALSRPINRLAMVDVRAQQTHKDVKAHV